MERAGFLIRFLSYTLDRIVMFVVALAVIFGSGLAGTIFSPITFSHRLRAIGYNSQYQSHMVVYRA
jgi:hypothetical protein